jgi:hypothetical protein
MTTPCRLLSVALPSMITHCLADAGVRVLAIFTWLLRRPITARPEVLVKSPQIFDLALIPIVGICPQINHMKLNKLTRRLLLSPSVRIARSELFLFLSFLAVTTCGITQWPALAFIHG